MTDMIFITLAKFKQKPTKETTEKIGKNFANPPKGIKVISVYWTLGRYDGVLIFEAPDEKAAMKFSIRLGEASSTETMVAVPRAEAIKLL